MPAVGLYLPVLPLPDSLLPAGALQLQAPLLLAAPLDERDPLQSALDLTPRASPLFTLGGGGRLFVVRLVSSSARALAQWTWHRMNKGQSLALPLCQCPQTIHLPALPVAPPSASSATSAVADAAPFATALGFAALAGDGDNSSSAANASASSAPLVQMNQVTLVLPVLDYLALLVLGADGANGTGSSLRACLDDATLRHAAQLQRGITRLKFDNGTWDGMCLSAYAGWRVNGTWLTLRPQTPVPAGVVQRCGGGGGAQAPAPAAASGAGSGDEDEGSSAPVGAIVGGVVGGVALLAALAAALVWRQRRLRGTDLLCVHRRVLLPSLFCWR